MDRIVCRTAAIALTAALPTLLGCDEDQPPAQPAPTAPPTAPIAAATVTAEQSARPAEQEVCQREEHEVWGKGVNPRTGLTAARLPDGRIALGVAFGTRPHQLVFDGAGKGHLAKIPLEEGTELAKVIQPSEGVRHLQRVTVAGGGKTFADYRDKYADKRRRIACGPTGEEAPLLVFDGIPLIDTAHYDQDKEAKKISRPTKPAPADEKPQRKGVLARKQPAAKKGADGAEQDRDEPGRTAKLATDQARATVAKADGKPKTEREIRDCRSFADPSGEDVWAVGTELVGEHQAGGDTKWTMRFFVDVDRGRRQIELHSVALAKTPEKLYTLEAPVAHQLGSGAWVLAGRYRGRMFAWLLNPDKTKRGSLQTYGGGYPGLPRFVADDEDHLLLTSQKVDLSHWKLRAVRLDSRHARLLEALEQPAVGEEADSLAEPTFARAGDQGWLAFHRGDRRQGRVMLVPVNDELAAEGRSVMVTPEGQAVYESHLFALEKGRLLLVYIHRPPKGATELVSDVLSCQAVL